MTLTLIGLGLGDEKDITVKGLRKVQEAHVVYLDAYTSFLSVDKEKLGEYYNKEVIALSRERIESLDFLDEAKEKEVVLLVVGDPFSATTHYTIVQEAKKKGIAVEVVHNASILTAVGECGLSLYKFGQTTSLPKDYKPIDSTFEAIKANLSLGLHTLVLLDLDPKNETTLSFSEACNYLLQKGLDEKTKCVGIVRLGQEGQQFVAGTLINLGKKDIKKYPQCLIVCGKLHFMEEESISYL